MTEWRSGLSRIGLAIGVIAVIFLFAGAANAQEVLKDKDENTDVYVSTNSVEAVKNLAAGGDKNTLKKWGNNLGGVVDPDSYAKMADNASKLGDDTELKAGWEQAKKTLGVTGDLTPELDASNQQLRAQLLQELTEQNGGEVPENLKLYLDQNGDIAAMEVGGVPVYMDEQLEQQFAAELENRSERLIAEIAQQEQSDAYIASLEDTLNGVWSDTEEQYFTAQGESNQKLKDFPLPILGSLQEQASREEYSSWRAPAIEEHEAQYGPRRDMGDLDGELRDIGLTLLGGASRSTLDNTTELGGMLFDGLARGSQGTPGYLPYAFPGETPMEVEPIGAKWADGIQNWANTEAETGERGMIQRIYGALRASYFLNRAFRCVARSDDDEALHFLNKGKKAFPEETYTELLLRGFLYCEKKEWNNAISNSLLALKKIESSKRLNHDEKKYLSAYAKDTINLSIVRGRLEKELVPVDLNFKTENVSERNKKRFKVVLEGRPCNPEK
ncbi:hypothetical protein [Marinimicrobium locisalis]|uniref:hypothetical protein n=1 Tax=Marinimicrobium locisalis TaxID=546022 RepID=UPI0032220D30